MSTIDFVAQMEALFGTDTVCGLTFTEEVAVGERCVWTADEYDALPEPRPYAESRLPNGWSGTCCTGYAHLVEERLPGRVRVVGFANKDNPTSRIARESWHPGGHDFAIVDDRFIVDPWPRLVRFGAPTTKMVYDMQCEAELVLDIYGPRDCWQGIPA